MGSKRQMIDLPIEPMDVPSVADWVNAVNWYADRFLATAHENETLNDFAEQCALDWKDPKMATEVKAEVRRRGSKRTWAY